MDLHGMSAETAQALQVSPGTSWSSAGSKRSQSGIFRYPMETSLNRPDGHFCAAFRPVGEEACLSGTRKISTQGLVMALLHDQLQCETEGQIRVSVT